MTRQEAEAEIERLKAALKLAFVKLHDGVDRAQVQSELRAAIFDINAKPLNKATAKPAASD